MWKIAETNEWHLLEKEFEWVSDMKGVIQDKIHHQEGDVAIHTRMVLDALLKLPAYQELTEQEQHILFAAALLHDVEKRSTTTVEEDGSVTSKNHAKKGALTTRTILYKTIPAPFPIREQVCALVRFHGLPLWAIEKTDPAKAVIEASLHLSTKMLAILARADVLGRVCKDQQDLLYKIDLFEALCEENECWGRPRSFSTPAAKFHYLQRDGSYPAFVPFDKPGSRVVLMCGLPGAGKDSYVRKHYKDLPVVNLDDIRKKYKISPTDTRGNGTVIQMAKEKARVLLRAGESFVWNATNVTRQMREQLVDLFITYDAFVTIIYVEVAYEKLHVQNNNREAVVPRMVIEKLLQKLEMPLQSEAHEVIYKF